tara:strand:- start:1351 stop:1542 length:192 start_codon:yes stop_codon:yes gene_type:complete
MAYEYSSNSSRRNGYDNSKFSEGYDRIFSDSKPIKDRLALNKVGKVTRVVTSSEVMNTGKVST